jgi:replicative superfamily II helicase
MEGVNFPAKNIILHNPKTGKEPMNDIDFLNIAGRGGRLKKDFFGNVYCIDIDEWEGGYRPDIEQKDHFIKSSMDEVVENNKEEIIRHLKKLLKSKPKADVEAAITRFIIKGVQNANEEFIEGMIRRGTKISQAELDKITKLVHDITREIVIPEDVLLTNKSIDPRLQNRLYVALSSKQKLPQLYSVNNNEFYNSLKEILEETYEAFNKKNKTKEIPKVTMNCNLWIKEKTLKEMISDRLNYKRKFGALSSQEINDVIDRTIRMIEKKVRYELSQDVGCYIGIYSHIAEKRNIEVNDMVKNIGYYLELGAYRPTTLTLINNGIPRSLAITLSKRLPQDVTDFDTLKRLIDRQIEQIKIEIPPFLIDEYLTFKTTQLKLNDN